MGEVVYEKPNKVQRFSRRMAWMFGVYLKPRHVATVETLNGVLSFDSKDRWLGRQLCVYREFEYPEMIETIDTLRRLGYLPEENGGRFMDVGGYIGMISTGFLKAGIFEKSLVFEPNPNSFALIEKNIKQNNFEGRVDSRNVALSDQASTLVMELSERNYGDNRVRSAGHDEKDHFNESGRETIDIEAITLDAFYQREPEVFDGLRLVWMDIQGHEGKFFAGGKEFFKQHLHLPVVMEFWPYGLRRSGMSREDFCRVVKECFTHFHVLGEDVDTKRDINEVDAVYDRFTGPGDGCHLLLLREE